ncbi:indole-3-glycerol phosphate synthase TrpC [Blattabacterium cuenoti]|uniref:indole-3-glycerol phosphate synthase TrpC n=1 Tax=Blattabacterium cuenoti TaxID=1653831 RepID=UPI00163C48D2|nr:indole-3-glycerol phosphate synthase TrpC [Blattabacterium cuenoti]
MNLLDQIISFKRKEVTRKKEFFSRKKLENNFLFERKCISLSNKLKESNTGIIAEFKRKSPSKGVINTTVSVEKVVKDYENAGASGISILTEWNFFSGKNEDLKKAREIVSLPLLRKDFIIDEYQIIESKSIGSDVILLISEILSKKEIKNHVYIAKSIGLEVVIEIHKENEIDKITDHTDVIVGINNRNLKTFIVDPEHCLKLSSKIPNLKIAESGFSKNPKNILLLRKKGFKGFLIGEHFMKTNDPGISCKNMIKSLEVKI